MCCCEVDDKVCCSKDTRDTAIASYRTRKLLLVLLLKSVPRFRLSMRTEEIIIARYMTGLQLLHGMAVDARLGEGVEVSITLNRQYMLIWKFFRWNCVVVVPLVGD